MKYHSSALWNRLRILTRMCTVCGDVNKGLEPSYRYLGELETDRVGGGAEVGCVASDPRTSRAPRPGHHSRSWVRRQILCEDMYLRSYLLFICVHILLYCCSMHLHAGSFPLSEISIRAFGLTPGLGHSFVHSQVYHRDESSTRQRSECMGSGRTSDIGAD